VAGDADLGRFSADSAAAAGSRNVHAHAPIASRRLSTPSMPLLLTSRRRILILHIDEPSFLACRACFALQANRLSGMVAPLGDARGQAADYGGTHTAVGRFANNPRGLRRIGRALAVVSAGLASRPPRAGGQVRLTPAGPSCRQE